MADSDGGPSCPGAVGRLAWVPIPVLLATIVALRLHQVETVFEPMLLMLALSIIFSGGVSGVIVALGSRSYARDPSRAVLLLSCGMLAFGLAGLSGGVLLPEAPLNATVTVYNTGSWLTGLCCLASAMGALVPRSDRRAGRPRMVMLSAYAAVLACMAAVTLAATSGLTPPFFAQGQGPTLLRQMVLGSAAAMTALAAVLYGLLNVRVQSAFVRWYALGLGLFALGLVGMMPMHRLGSVSAWVGRSAQYLGCLYILWGAWRGVVEGRSWELPLGTLLETQERHRRLVEVCPDAILVHTDGRCVFANPAAVRLLGAASPQDLMGRPILDFIHPECREISAARIRQAYESDRPVPVRTLRVLRLDGSPVDVEITGSRVDFGGRMAVQAVMRDVGERVRAEEALRESERRFKATFENAAVGLAHVALDGRFLWVNRQFCEVTGYGADELLGRTFQQITFADDLEHDLEQAGRLLSGEFASYALEKRYVRKDGSVVWVNLTVSLQRDADGAPDHFVSVVEDIDERKQAEEALGQSRRELQALNASLEQRVAERTAQVQRLADQLHALAVQLSRTEQRERKRVARILHDHIQQLLVAARMQLAAARRDHDVERVQSMLLGADAVLQEAVDASRSVAIELSPPILHQAGLIGGLKWLAARMAENNDFRVHLRIDEAAEPAAEELRLLLFECVRELLFNALKHSGAREAHVALDRAGDGSARIVVQDEGRGFDPEQLRTRQAGDLTFGLFSIQQRLVDIGGEMAIDAAPGRGTRITLAVPLGEGQPAPAGGEPSAPAAAPAAALEPAGRTGKIRVLLVDDHRILREGLAGLLQFEADIEVVGEAADGPQAVALAEELRPDVVTMDVSMPGMSGPEATRIILGKLPQARVIGLSMHIDGGVADAMRQAGAVSYLTKGGPSEDLVAAIRACRPN